MGNPNFQAPLSTANELRRAVVTFARGVKQQDCITVYSLVGNRSNMSFEVYLENVMRAGFWVGTIFFIWTSMAFGVTIRSHFFNEFREPKCESTAEFISKYFSKDFSDDLDQQPVVDVFFHQYRCMTRCKPSMYNHFAALIPIDNLTGDESILNVLVNQVGLPWWKKTEEINGYDCSGRQPKPSKAKKDMTKEDRIKFSRALTYHYIKQQNNGNELYDEMEKQLENVTEKDDSVDVGVARIQGEEKHEVMTCCRSLTRKLVDRSWIQRANIIFLFLHPRIGKHNTGITAELTGVNEHTLLGWLTQKKMIAMWIDIVEDLTAEVAIKALPTNVQELYFDVDPESTVSTLRYRRRINNFNNQLQIYYKGGKVRQKGATFFPSKL